MRILALETTDLAGSVAALADGQLLGKRDLDPAMRSAQSLAGAIADLLRHLEWQASAVELIAVATGPGSFTGLRVGVTTAKMFAYAVGAEALGINTLEAIAQQAPADVRELWAVLDAQRDQVFAAHFSRSDRGIWQWVMQTSLFDDTAWLAQLSPPVAVSGPALVKLFDRLPSGVVALDRDVWSPKAAGLGELAWRHYQCGRRDDLRSLVPHYFRPSAAEEKRRRTAK